ncbi:hypothetical protein EST92_16440 [Streptomyces sp. TM32]|nr:hypothetical protein EST92_16440 [Streptomyces sp. TM32]
MAMQLGHDGVGKVHRVLARPWLRITDHLLAVGGLRRGAPDPHHPLVDVDVAATQLREFFGTQGREGAEEDHDAPAGSDGFGRRMDLFDLGGVAFAGLLLAGALDPAWIALEEVVVDRCLKDGLQQAVGLGHRRL